MFVCILLLALSMLERGICFSLDLSAFKFRLQCRLWSASSDSSIPSSSDGAENLWSKAEQQLLSGAGEQFLIEKLGRVESRVLSEQARREDMREMARPSLSKDQRSSSTSRRLEVARDGDAKNGDDNKSTEGNVTYASATANTSGSGYVSGTTQSPPQQPQEQESKLPLPFMDTNTVGLMGAWIEKEGNFLLKPDLVSLNIDRPLGVVHFLGGAFVGAAPHLTYRYLLESLVNAGYVVVATPYQLDFDYLEICDSILTKFDNVAVDLAREYGAIPVIGIGHSCGALLQTLITSLFPNAPRAANILISFNNRPAKDAIPGFEEMIVPISEFLTSNENSQMKQIRSVANSGRQLFDSSLRTYAKSMFAPKFVDNELVPLVNQGLEIVDQLPGLLQSIADGSREFDPSPQDTKESLRRMYRARSTLLLKFEDDTLDESIEIESTLREANTILRMKRPMVNLEVDLRVLSGTHLTPLSQTFIPGPPEGFEDALSDVRQGLKKNVLQQANEVSRTILDFLREASISASSSF
jgi:hypothetical protein